MPSIRLRPSLSSRRTPCARSTANSGASETGAAYGCMTQRRSRAINAAAALDGVDSGALGTSAPHRLPARRGARRHRRPRQLVSALVERDTGVPWHVHQAHLWNARDLLLDAADQLLVQIGRAHV